MVFEALKTCDTLRHPKIRHRNIYIDITRLNTNHSSGDLIANESKPDIERPNQVFTEKSTQTKELDENQLDANESDIYYSDDNEEVFAEEMANETSMSVNNSKSKAEISSAKTLASTPGVTFASELFMQRLRESFNDQNTSDLEFNAEDKTIYCHKSVIQLRNQKFWQYCQTRVADDRIALNPNKFDAFEAFVQHLYGITPDISDGFVRDLQCMAQIFGEPALQYLCAHLIEQIDNRAQHLKKDINQFNVCSLYSKAVEEGLHDMEKCCVEFAANNWKDILKSEAFKSMNDRHSKRLIMSVFDFIP